MPKFVCLYCDSALTHDSASVRRKHMQGRKHNANVEDYWLQVATEVGLIPSTRTLAHPHGQFWVHRDLSGGTHQPFNPLDQTAQLANTNLPGLGETDDADPDGDAVKRSIPPPANIPSKVANRLFL